MKKDELEDQIRRHENRILIEEIVKALFITALIGAWVVGLMWFYGL